MQKETERGEKITPRGEKETQRGEKITPRKEKETPRGERETQRGEKIAQRGEEITQRGENGENGRSCQRRHTRFVFCALLELYDCGLLELYDCGLLELDDATHNGEEDLGRSDSDSGRCDSDSGRCDAAGPIVVVDNDQDIDNGDENKSAPPRQPCAKKDERHTIFDVDNLNYKNKQWKYVRVDWEQISLSNEYLLMESSEFDKIMEGKVEMPSGRTDWPEYSVEKMRQLETIKDIAEDVSKYAPHCYEMRTILYNIKIDEQEMKEKANNLDSDWKRRWYQRKADYLEDMRWDIEELIKDTIRLLEEKKQKQILREIKQKEFFQLYLMLHKEVRKIKDQEFDLLKLLC